MLDLPNTLLRFFAREEHALRFVSGEIRCGRLSHYRGIEGTRQDETEGRPSFEWPTMAPAFRIDSDTGRLIGPTKSDRNIRCRGSSLNEFYIVSTSSPDADKDILGEKFGRFTVLISDPPALVERISAAWRSHGFALHGGVKIVPVDYDKDEVVEANEYLIAPPRYDYSQKPACFEMEREFRYVLTCRMDVSRHWPDHVALDVGDCADLCRVGFD